MEHVPLLMVTVSGLAPGAPLDAAVDLADALDARRVPLTLLVGPRPHPEVVAWARARRRVGDAVLLHGTRADTDAGPSRGASKFYRRLPAHEAGLRLAGALRTRDALGLPVDGFAAPGWAVSAGVRTALAAAGLDLCVDDDGVHRLAASGEHAVKGTPIASRRGPVTGPGSPTARRPLRAQTSELVHLALSVPRDAGVAGGLLDRALARGATPVAATDVLARAAAPRARRSGSPDPEQWSITA